MVHTVEHTITAESHVQNETVTSCFSPPSAHDQGQPPIITSDCCGCTLECRPDRLLSSSVARTCVVTSPQPVMTNRPIISLSHIAGDTLGIVVKYMNDPTCDFVLPCQVSFQRHDAIHPHS